MFKLNLLPAKRRKHLFGYRWSHSARVPSKSCYVSSAGQLHGSTHFKIMATALKDSVIHWRKKLEKHTDDEIILSVIRKLSRIPITLEILEETHIGRCIRKLSKRQDIVGEKALAVLKKWRVAFTSCEESSSKNSLKSSNNRSKKENINKESTKSTSKNDVSHEKSDEKEKTHLKFSEPKQRNGSAPKSNIPQSSKYNREYDLNMSERSSPSRYTYEKEASQAKYMDYDPHTDINEGYNPECPELYPGSQIKTPKVKQSDSTDTYNPSSVKRKSNLEEDTDSKAKYKKQKSDNHSKDYSSYEAKHSALKKEKKEKQCSSHKDKGTLSSNLKKESSDKLKHKSSESKKLKRDSSEKNSSTSKTKKGKIKINCAEEFTSSEVRFEDCLGFNDIVIKKKNVKSQSTSSRKKPLSNSNKTSVSGSSHVKEKASKQADKPRKDKLHLHVPKPVSTVKIDEVDIVSTLPEIQPNYRPLPQRSLDFTLSKKKVLSNEEAIKFTSSRREKTAVYSGRKSYYTEVPTLFESCTRVLIENIDAIEYMGGVPFFILKPVLERCTPDQLFDIEHYNPYLLEDTHDLWEVHCKRDYRLLTPQENETWRELYLRAQEEREKKLRSITANISASMSKSNPVRQVKLAYVDSVAKPPRDVARRQAKHGTALPVTHTIKAGPPSKATPRPTAPVINSGASSAAAPNIIPKKPKVAPLMAKTLKSMKMCFRR